ncbi:GAF domain-containing protein [Streptomyces malaysiensis subsp. malaysiensis]|uniref:helix-turn-helix domain-containing protein n=1 Tax=Streptomyces malaysiensis TaxID=92644 RepID=UPI0024BF8DD2|nr:GAF domain-containing protein [Streptomyces sp. NA07423]WHX15615.1 GAF domain-containing protein [Streptomyces sp. NA07423]
MSTLSREGAGPARSSGSESHAELRRWLEAVQALSTAVSSGRSLREVLDLVADTARSLLGFDFCGVLIPDGSGRNLVIEGWSGLSAEYVARVNSDRPVRLRGNGLHHAPSSQAFRSGEPVAVRDIAREPQFTPWGGVAKEQGYRSMLSVPLVAGSEVVGTLNSYHSVAHDFTDHEIERLTLLANHAAIALTSARMVGELQQLTTSLRGQRDLLTKSERIHERLLAVALRAGGLDGIVMTLAELVSRPVLVEDARGTVLALTGPLAELPGADVRAALPLEEDQAEPHMLGTGLVREHGDHVAATVRLAGEVVARLWLPRGAGGFSALDERALEHASIVVSLELFRLRTGTEVEHRLRGELLTDILSGAAAESRPLRERADRLGHDLSRPHAALVGQLEVATESRRPRAYQRALTLVSELAATYRPRPLVAMHRGAMVALWPLDGVRTGAAAGATGQAEPMGAVASSIRRAMASVPGAEGATVAVSAAERQTVRQAYRTARGALNVALRTGRSDIVVTPDDLGVAGLLLQLNDARQLVAFADRTLAAVREHDLRRGTHLLRTLRVYLDSDLSRTEAAQRLNLHPNTVSQRLRRIEVVADIDLSAPTTIVEVSAALLLLDVAEGGQPA